jgi:uncharacterized protein (TIGR02722 family)
MKLLKQRTVFTAIVAFCFLLMSACAPQTRLIRSDAEETAITTGLDRTDFEHAASMVTQSLLSSNTVNRNDGNKNILVISNILNDTMQRIDTDQLVKKIRIELLRSGKVMVTTAIGLHGAEDQMNAKYSQLSESRKVNQQTVVSQSFTAPNMSLSGKIIQRDNRLANGEERIDYYFQLSLTDLKVGLAVWEDEVPITKITGGKSVSW